MVLVLGMFQCIQVEFLRYYTLINVDPQGREWNADVSTGEEFAKNAYFDTKKGGIDLAKFLADRFV